MPRREKEKGGRDEGDSFDKSESGSQAQMGRRSSGFLKVKGSFSGLPSVPVGLFTSEADKAKHQAERLQRQAGDIEVSADEKLLRLRKQLEEAEAEKQRELERAAKLKGDAAKAQERHKQLSYGERLQEAEDAVKEASRAIKKLVKLETKKKEEIAAEQDQLTIIERKIAAAKKTLETLQNEQQQLIAQGAPAGQKGGMTTMRQYRKPSFSSDEEDEEVSEPRATQSNIGSRAAPPLPPAPSDFRFQLQQVQAQKRGAQQQATRSGPDEKVYKGLGKITGPVNERVFIDEQYPGSKFPIVAESEKEFTFAYSTDNEEIMHSTRNLYDGDWKQTKADRVAPPPVPANRPRSDKR